jgi:hypothetical protein
MRDNLKFDYLELDYPNIVMEIPKNYDHADLTRDIEPTIKKLIIPLALKNPSWTFVANKGWHQTRDDKLMAFRFQVYQDGELLGTLNTAYGRGNEDGRVYVISNDRIEKSRQRGSDIKTKDLAKAMKAVTKSFGAKSINEIATEAANHANNLIRSVAYDRERTYSNRMNYMVKHLEKHMVENLATYIPLAVQGGADPSLLDSLATNYEEYQAIEVINTCYQNDNVRLVLIRGNDYVVFNSPQTSKQREVKVYATETLPAHLKRGVGMLKLVDDRHLIANIGVRVNETTYVVIGETDE